MNDNKHNLHVLGFFKETLWLEWPKLEKTWEIPSKSRKGLQWMNIQSNIALFTRAQLSILALTVLKKLYQTTVLSGNKTLKNSYFCV